MAHLARFEFICVFIELLFVKHQQSVKLNFIIFALQRHNPYGHQLYMLISGLTFGSPRK